MKRSHLYKNFKWKSSTNSVNIFIRQKYGVPLKMAHVTKHVMVLPHLGYVSSYD